MSGSDLKLPKMAKSQKRKRLSLKDRVALARSHYACPCMDPALEKYDG
jgi:hypothetical protein